MRVGCYVHHHGRGHLQRALALAATPGVEVTVLSSVPAPVEGVDWVVLPRDDDHPPHTGTDAGGRLHWAPLRHDGLLTRTAAVSAWLARARPDVVVVDVSVEVTALVRLHGVPVVSVVLPGVRDDAPHLLGFDLADRLVAFWPPAATGPAGAGMLRGAPDEVVRRVRALGALSLRPATLPGPGSPASAPAGPRRVVLLGGTGGDDLDADRLDAARAATPGWEWTVLGRHGTWVDDPMPLLATADVVVTHAGQNALAEVATARRPAVVLPQVRPHDEQVTTGSVLAAIGAPVAVEDHWPRDWAPLLDRVAALDGQDWSRWCDGGALRRWVQVLEELA